MGYYLESFFAINDENMNKVEELLEEADIQLTDFFVNQGYEENISVIVFDGIKDDTERMIKRILEENEIDYKLLSIGEENDDVEWESIIANENTELWDFHFNLQRKAEWEKARKTIVYKEE